MAIWLLTIMRSEQYNVPKIDNNKFNSSVRSVRICVIRDESWNGKNRAGKQQPNQRSECAIDAINLNMIVSLYVHGMSMCVSECLFVFVPEQIIKIDSKQHHHSERSGCVYSKRQRISQRWPSSSQFIICWPPPGVGYSRNITYNIHTHTVIKCFPLCPLIPFDLMILL